MQRPTKGGILATLGPGILVAATGVGAGDIATASFVGSSLAYTVLWAALLGAFVKFVVNEGLARWQLATGQTLLEGAVTHFGRPVQWVFLVYLLVWSFGVGSALISACGVTGHALLPLFDDARTGKIFWGVVHSIVTVVLILLGGYKSFEKVMTALLVLMFGSVMVAAVMIKPPWNEVARGMFVPRIPREAGGQGVQWTLALMGGVGGTLTMLCYGYWIREQGRTGPEFLRTTRIDLGVAYLVTGLFGVAMVIIGTGLHLAERGGEQIMIKLADKMGAALGTPMRWVFLAGAWAAVFTSMLGVWQAVPYLFSDFWQLFTRRRRDAAGADAVRDVVDTKSPVYRGYLFALAVVPMLGLWQSFVVVQRTYSLLGAVVMPLLAVALLILNGRGDLVGERFRNRPLTVAVLIAVLLFFAYAGYVTIRTFGRESILS
jgi:Mn2+/Fe2+ NRAMP family transporter